MVILCVCLGTVQYWWISIGLVVVQLRVVFCPSVQYLSLFCEAFSWTILDSSRFPLFHSGQVFHHLVCPLTVVLPQIFFNLTTLFSYPVSFSLFRAPLDFVIRVRSFRLKSFLSQFSPFVAQIKNFWSGLRTKDPKQTNKKNQPGSLQTFLICATKGENWERKDSNLRDLRHTGNEQQHHEVHEKAKENWIGN